jgi:hypothetical protein
MDAPARKPPNTQKQRRTHPNGQGRVDSRPEPAMPHTRPDPTKPPDIQRLTEICSKIVKEKAHLFAAVKGSMGNDDLLQIALIRAIQVHPDYDPTRGNYGPFISIRVKNTLLDFRKSVMATAERETKLVKGNVPLRDDGAVDVTIRDLPSKVLVCQGIDTEIQELSGRLNEAEADGPESDFQVSDGLDYAIFELQKLRMRFIGEYLPVEAGKRRFSANSFTMFAPKKKD